MARLSDAFIDDLLARTDIVELVGARVPLKRQGKEYAARCPFHDERSASFTVSPTKQFYHCFGCGAHGTAISFLMNFDRLEFLDAVDELAKRAGMEVPRDTRQKNEDTGTRELYSALDAAARFFRQQLAGSDKARAYVDRRGIAPEIVERYAIGYAPDGYNGLRDALGTDERRMQLLERAGLFSKGRELYGLYLARNAIRDAGRVVVVEGYMDVVALAQHGIDYAVATLGTSTTATHAQKLLRLSDAVVFCFDGDAAGRKAAWRALESVLPVLADGKEARFLFLPDGEDPDDFVRRRGKDAFERALDAALPLSQYLLAELSAQHSPTTAEGRAALVAAAKPYVGQIGAPILGTLLRRQLAELAGLPEAQLGSLLASGPAGGAAGRRDPSPRGGRAAGPARRPPSLLRELLQGLVLEPSLARRHDLPRIDEPGLEAAAWNAVLEHCMSGTTEATTAGIVQHFADSAHAQAIAAVLALAADQALPADQVEVQVLAAAQKLRRAEGQRELHALLSQPLSSLSAEERESLTERLKAGRNDGPAAR
jgi:DNA primase